MSETDSQALDWLERLLKYHKNSWKPYTDYVIRVDSLGISLCGRDPEPSLREVIRKAIERKK